MTRNHVVGSILLGALAGSLAGCTDEATHEARFELSRLASCDDVRERIRAQALADMEARLEAALQEALEYDCSNGPVIFDSAQDDAYTPSGPPSGGGGPPAPSQSSGTNNQVAGVDEADFVKNQDGYLYIANAGKLRIIDAWPADQTHVVSEVAIEGDVRKLFLYNGRAVVYSSLGAASPFQRECTYGYGCDFLGDGRPTKVTVVDVRAVAAPRIVREIDLSGSLIAARRVGPGVHTIVADQAQPVADLAYWPEGLDSCSSSIMKSYAFERLRRHNRQLIEESGIDLFLPTATDSVTGELGGRCEQFYGADVGDGSALTSVLSLDLPDLDAPAEPTDPAEPAARGQASFTSIVSRPGAVYGAEDALYVAVPRARTRGSDEASAIHKFAIAKGPGGVEYRGTGRVPGHVLNQFAMDQYKDVLRVATTTGQVPEENVHSTLTTLREAADGGLETVGVIDDLAPGEDIRSVRFAESRGFVVTFKKTDPLYVFDLEQPEAPRVLSELKIPGFSTYMHMLDDTHLLSIGYDAADQGSFAWFTGMLLQIFDVSNPTAPALTHRRVIGTRGSSSEALTNHLAFTYFAPRQALALPMTICEGGQPPSYGDMTFSGLLVFHAAAADGFAELGRVTHPPAADVSCGNWWTDGASQVRRSVFMDDYVYSISGTTLKVNALGNLATDLVTLPIAN
jgi:hypothetical protein